MVSEHQAEQLAGFARGPISGTSAGALPVEASVTRDVSHSRDAAVDCVWPLPMSQFAMQGKEGSNRRIVVSAGYADGNLRCDSGKTLVS